MSRARWTRAAATALTLLAAAGTAGCGKPELPSAVTQSGDPNPATGDAVAEHVAAEPAHGQRQKSGYFSDSLKVDGVEFTPPGGDARLEGEGYTATVTGIAHAYQLDTPSGTLLAPGGEQFTIATINLDYSKLAKVGAQPVASPEVKPSFALEVNGARHPISAGGPPAGLASAPLTATITVVASAPASAKVVLRGSQTYTDQTIDLADLTRSGAPQVLYRTNSSSLVNRTIGVDWHGGTGNRSASGTVSVTVQNANLFWQVGGTRAADPGRALLTVTSRGWVTNGTVGGSDSYYDNYNHLIPEHAQLILPDGTAITPRFLLDSDHRGWLSGVPVWDVPADFTAGTLRLNPDGIYQGSVADIPISIPKK